MEVVEEEEEEVVEHFKVPIYLSQFLMDMILLVHIATNENYLFEQLMLHAKC